MIIGLPYDNPERLVEALLNERVVTIRQRSNDCSKWQAFVQALTSVFSPDSLGDFPGDKTESPAAEEAIGKMRNLMQQFDIVVV